MRRWSVAASVVALVVLIAAGPTQAFTCPVLIQEAETTIQEAEQQIASLSGSARTLAVRYIEMAREYAELAETYHNRASQEGRDLHFESELYAQFAKTLADHALRVIALSS